MNDVFHSLNLRAPSLMKEFYDSCGISKARKIGGSFAGPDLDRLVHDRSLTSLVWTLDLAGIDHGLELAEYLRSLREYHKLCVRKKLPEDWSRTVEEFRLAFRAVHTAELVSWTPKLHVCYDHIPQYFTMTSHTLYCADSSPTESTHSRLRKVGEIHSTNTVSNLGTDNHVRRKMTETLRYNWKNMPNGVAVPRVVEVDPGLPPDLIPPDVGDTADEAEVMEVTHDDLDLTMLASEVMVDVSGNDMNVAAPFTEVRSEAEADTIIAQRDFVIFGFGDADSAIMKTFANTADKLREDFVFAHTNTAAVMAKLGHEEGVVLFRPKHLVNHYEASAVLYTGAENEDELLAWIKSNKHGLVGIRTRENAEEFQV